ncbi:MAG: family 16 glycoside hydrolase [Candidatus Anammoxibacter sp.]
MRKAKIFGICFLFLLFVAIGCKAEYGRESGEKEAVEYDEKQIQYKGKAKLWNFEDAKTGKLPDDFSNQMTGKGGIGKWEVVKDHTAPSAPNVLGQTSQEYFGYHFNMAINEKKTYDDLEISVKFKGVKGEEDQGGGPVWRYQDPDNYYIARANPLENNFRVYKVVNGNRLQMDSARVKVTSNEWHTINIITRKDRIQCYYDGRLYLEVTDDTFKSGKIGLWTKADAVTYFDDLEVRPLK